MSQSMSPERGRLTQMIAGYWVSQMLHVAARLHVADHLANGSCTVTELAQKTGSHPRSLGRLLRALSSLGIFAETSTGRFELSAAAEYLRDDHPETVCPMALMLGGVQYEAWCELSYSVATGRSGFEKRFGKPVFDYLAEHPREAAEFDRAMVAIHGNETAHFLDAYDFAGCSRIVDVGGGNGSQLIGILGQLPGLSGTVFDLPHVAARAAEELAKVGLAGRATAEGGSFFEEIPAGADAYLLRHIIHDWDDDASIAILRQIRQAIPAHGKLLILETVIPEGNDPHFAKLLDITMLVVPGGIERTEAEYRELTEAAEFSIKRIVSTAAGVDIIECTPK